MYEKNYRTFGGIDASTLHTRKTVVHLHLEVLSMSIRYPENFGWRFLLDDDEAFALLEFDDSQWEQVDIPHSMVAVPLQYHAYPTQPSIGWYRTWIDLSDIKPRGHLRLRFEGVSIHAVVYLNGVCAGEHFGAFTPFEITIPERLIEHDRLLVAVRCDATENPEIPPFGHVVDYLVPGGIYREVSLIASDNRWIADVVVRSTGELRREYRTVQVEVTVGNFHLQDSSATIAVEVLDLDGMCCATAKEPLFGSPAQITFPIGPVTLWDIDRPALYSVRVHLQMQDCSDTYTVRTGFRDLEWHAEGLVLNGKAVKLRGLNRHQLYAHVGFAMPKRQQRRDAEFLRTDLQVNCVRTSHYPQSSHFLDRCDELGLLVFEEVPGWQHIGASSEWREHLVQQLREMIVRDRNHPSIMLWGVRVNESGDDDELYERTNEVARILDSTRATAGVRNFAGSRLLERVYTYNDFSYAGRGRALANPKRIVRDPKTPYIVTEHTGHMFPCRATDPESIRTEHALRHAQVLQAMYHDRRIGGAFGWCMSDYATHRQFGKEDGVCYHGIADMFRIPKLAGALYRSQGDGTVEMEVSSSLRIGAVPAHALDQIWVFTNCDRVQLLYNGEEIGVYLPDRNRFFDLPHPPIRIDDLIGSRIKELSDLSEKERQVVRQILNLAVTHGFDLPLTKKIALGRIMLRHHMSTSDTVRLFERFMLFWDGSDQRWTFNGIIGDQVVCTRIIAPPSEPRLVLISDGSSLHPEETYDLLRCVVRMEDSHGQLLRESTAAVSISLFGPLCLIGPPLVALAGGVTGFYVRTIGEVGTGEITVSSYGVPSATVSVTVD